MWALILVTFAVADPPNARFNPVYFSQEYSSQERCEAAKSGLRRIFVEKVEGLSVFWRTKKTPERCATTNASMWKLPAPKNKCEHVPAGRRVARCASAERLPHSQHGRRFGSRRYVEARPDLEHGWRCGERSGPEPSITTHQPLRRF